MLYEFIIDPLAKPRMTQRDKFNPGRAAIKYFAFKAALKLMANLKGLRELPGEVWIKFFIPMPRSWNNKKREEKFYTPHEQRPDLDNLVKSVFDTLTDEDSHIHDLKARKIWHNIGKIQIKI